MEQEGVLISIKQVNLKVPYRNYVSILFTLEIDIIRSMIDELPIKQLELNQCGAKRIFSAQDNLSSLEKSICYGS